MTTEWKELKTLQEVAAAQAAGEEIIVHHGLRWEPWNEDRWSFDAKYRSQPRKKTKTVVLREALLVYRGDYYARWTSDAVVDNGEVFVRWLGTPERTVEVEL